MIRPSDAAKAIQSLYSAAIRLKKDSYRNPKLRKADLEKVQSILSLEYEYMDTIKYHKKYGAVLEARRILDESKQILYEINAI